MKETTFTVKFIDKFIPVQSAHRACLALLGFAEKNCHKIESKNWIYSDGSFEKSTNIDNEINDSLEAGAIGFEVTLQLNQ